MLVADYVTPPWWIRLLAAVATAATVLATVRDARERDAVPAPVPPATVDIFLDPFTSTAAEVTRWRAAGRGAWCQLRLAVWEPSRPDAARFDPSLIGRPTGDGGWWLDLRQWDLLAPIVNDRLALCVAKRFTGVAFPADANAATGFDLTADDRAAFADHIRTLASVHRLDVLMTFG